MRIQSVLRGTGLVLGTMVLIIGCGGGEGAAGGGTVIIGTGQDPVTLFPPRAESVGARAVTELVFERLADRGVSLNTIGDADFVPRAAARWEWSPDSLRVTFHLDPRGRWHDNHPVTAGDVKFGFAVYTDPVIASRLGNDLKQVVDSISVTDSATCTVWFKQRSPEQFNTLATTLTPLPQHVLGAVIHDSAAVAAFAQNPIGNGPFKLVKWEPQVRLELRPSDSYAGARPTLDRVIFAFAPDAGTLLKQFMAGESDFLESLLPDDANVAGKDPNLRVVRLGSFAYNFLQFNLRDGASDRPHPLFGNRAMRRALTMALDRQLMARSVFDTFGHAGLGPFVRSQWSADTTVTQIAFDRAAAARLLDSLGWRAGPDGMRARNGKPLAFSLLVPTSSKARMSYSVLIQEQLRQVGVKVDVERMDMHALGDRWQKHTFDAAMGGLLAQPTPGGVRQTWGGDAAKPGGINYGGYLNPAFDAQADSAITSGNKTTARKHYRAAYQIIVDDAPGVWLYEPPILAGANARLQLGKIHSDAWWMGVPGWSIAPGKRLPRDAAPAKSP